MRALLALACLLVAIGVQGAAVNFNTSTLHVSPTNLQIRVSSLTNAGPSLLSATHVPLGPAAINWAPIYTRFLFEGDSLFNSGTPQSYLSNTWTKYQGFSAYSELANGGEGITDITSQYAAQVQPLSPSAPTNAVLFVWVGANDFAYFTNVVGAELYYSLLSNYWATAQADGWKVCAFTVMPRSGQETLEAGRQMVNDRIRNSMQWDYLADIALAMRNPYDLTYFTDGTHPTTNGYAIIAQAIDLALRQGQKHTPLKGYDFAVARTNWPFRVINETNGVELMRVQQNGFVGIGTNAPTLPLSVSGPAGAQYFYLDNDPNYYITKASGHTIIRTSDAFILYTGGSNERIRVNSTGSLGIMTNLPQARLHVHGSAIVATNITIGAKAIMGGPVTLKAYTVGTLPAGVAGDTAYVTDATAPTYLGALVGGGAVVTPVFYNGSAWVSY